MLSSYRDNANNKNYTVWWDDYLCLNCLVYRNGIFKKISTDTDTLTFIRSDDDYDSVGWLLQVAKKGKNLFKNQVKSSLTTIEFNCSTGKYRPVEISGFSGYFRQGKVLFQQNLNEPWKYPSPDGALIILKDYVCKR